MHCTIQQVLNCEFSAWYNCFKEVTFKSELIPLDENALQYLLADGIILPDGCEQTWDRSQLQEDSDDDQTDWESDAVDDDKPKPKLPELVNNINKAIEKLGGAVLPKLNWSAPKDAMWVTADGSLKCSSAGQVLMLLKSSSFCTHDLVEPFLMCSDYVEGQKYPVQYHLILRKWYDLHPSSEFRCFIKNKRLIGISQRHHSAYYDFLNNQRDAIVADLKDFYKNSIYDKFSDQNVVIDVYRKQQGIVYLMDFNPFGPVTDALLFTWDELSTLETSNNSTQNTVLRLVDSGGVQPNPLGQFGVPLDIVHLTTGQDANKLVDLMKMAQVKNNSSEDEDA